MISASFVEHRAHCESFQLCLTAEKQDQHTHVKPLGQQSTNLCHFSGSSLTLLFERCDFLPFTAHTVSGRPAKGRERGEQRERWLPLAPALIELCVFPPLIVSQRSEQLKPEKTRREQNASEIGLSGGETGADLRWKIHSKTTAKKREADYRKSSVAGGTLKFQVRNLRTGRSWREGSWSEAKTLPGLKCCPVCYFPSACSVCHFPTLSLFFFFMLTLPTPTLWSGNDCKTGCLLAAREVQMKF